MMITKKTGIILIISTIPVFHWNNHNKKNLGIIKLASALNIELVLGINYNVVQSFVFLQN